MDHLIIASFKIFILTCVDVWAVTNPELMTLMQNPKMQDVMKLMMTDGAQALEKAMQDDREVYEIVTKLNAVMNNAM